MQIPKMIQRLLAGKKLTQQEAQEERRKLREKVQHEFDELASTTMQLSAKMKEKL